MEFDFSEEQELLRSTARSFLEEHAPLSLCREVLESEDLYSRDLWKQVAEAGWLGTAIPEGYGGSGFGALELAVIAEELGRSLAPIPVSSSIYVAAEALLLAGSESQREQYLPGLASGERIGTFAFPEQLGQNGAAFETRFEDGRVTGRKFPVPDGGVADFAIVSARSSAGKLLCIVDLRAGGSEGRPARSFDPSRSMMQLSFRDVPAEVLGEEGQGAELAERLLDRAAALLAFEQVGGASRALEITRDFALHRFAFGRPVGSFQAIKHNLADRWSEIEIARSNAYYAAWALAGDEPELGVAAGLARATACEAFTSMSEEMIQVHGGVGYTWEYDCHLFYRRARWLSALLGGPSVWKQKIMDRLPASGRESEPRHRDEIGSER